MKHGGEGGGEEAPRPQAYYRRYPGQKAQASSRGRTTSLSQYDGVRPVDAAQFVLCLWQADAMGYKWIFTICFYYPRHPKCSIQILRSRPLPSRRQSYYCARRLVKMGSASQSRRGVSPRLWGARVQTIQQRLHFFVRHCLGQAGSRRRVRSVSI